MDLEAIFDYVPQLQQWVQNFPGADQPPRLSPEEFLTMMKYLSHYGSKLFTYLLNAGAEESEGAGPLDEEPVPIDIS